MKRTWTGYSALWVVAAGAGLALATSPDIVIKQVYGGGGNSGATYKNDFIELYNCGTAPATMNGWSVQYASATGSSWQVTPLTTFTLQPGQYYLIQEAAGAGGTLNLPTPDALGTIALGSTAGKIALVRTTVALTGACPLPDPNVVDFIGYGTTANCFETSPAPAPSNTLADVRSNCPDTDNNGVDFVTAAPAPHNSNSGVPTGACCDNNGLCYLVGQAACIAAGYTWSGAGTTCTPNPCSPICVTIADARDLQYGSTVTVCATLASKTDFISSANNKSITLQDSTGGITVFGTNADIDAIVNCAINEGHSIRLTGVTGTFNGLFQLQAPFANCLHTGQPGIPTPVPASGLDFADGSPTAEGLESMLVRVLCARFTTQGTFAGGTNYLVIDGDGVQFTVRVSTNDLDLVGQPIPTGYVDITGVFSQYDTSAPYDGSYQLLPRKWADLVPNAGCGEPTGACCVGGICHSDQTHAQCTALGGTYQGDATACNPDPCACEGIFAAKSQGPGYAAILCNVTLINDVDLVNSGFSQSIQLQDDDNGAAITVFGTNTEIEAILNNALLYNRITLQGFTSDFNGLMELVGPFSFDPNDVSTGYVPTAQLVTGQDFADGSLTAEALESKWVTVHCVTFADAGGTFQGVTTYLTTDAHGTIPIRIATTALDMVGQHIPAGPQDVTGIFSQSDTTPPHDGGYQLQLVHYAQVVPANGCGAATGACCVVGDCQSALDAVSCALLAGDYLGDGAGCLTNVCPRAVQEGDIALGLDSGSKFVTADLVRGGARVAGWPSRPYVQGLEFDNTLAAHNACGNLLALSYGAGGGSPGSPPTCTDPNRPDEAGKIYNLATNGTTDSQVIYDFNTLAGGIECTRISGLSASPTNDYLACWGPDLNTLYVLAYHEGAAPGTGTGVPFITQAWKYASLGASTGSQGTAWYSNNTMLVYNTSFVNTWSKLNRVQFDGTNFTVLGSKTITLPQTSGSRFTDVDYNAAISPYVFCLFSTYGGTPTGSYTYLTAVNPAANWAVVKTLDLSTVVDTGREIALGPDGYLYIAQYGSRIDRIPVADPANWTAAQCENYYTSATFATYCGLDVAFECPANAVGACCFIGDCAVLTPAQCTAAGGQYKGNGTVCSPTICGCIGDCNCDGTITFDDINPFVDALNGETPCSFENCDINSDGLINFDDINPFIDVLSFNPGPCP